MTVDSKAADSGFIVGRVLRSSIRGFVVASRIPEPDVPVFGSFVKAQIQQGATELIGLVYDIEVADDPFIRHLALQEEPDQVALADQREIRGVPIEVGVIAVGYRDDARIVQGLPPQPPIMLNRILVCEDAEVRAFTERLDFLRLLFNSREVPADELMVSCLHRAAEARPESERRTFKKACFFNLNALIQETLLQYALLTIILTCCSTTSSLNFPKSSIVLSKS